MDRARDTVSHTAFITALVLAGEIDEAHKVHESHLSRLLKRAPCDGVVPMLELDDAIELVAAQEIITLGERGIL